MKGHLWFEQPLWSKFAKILTRSSNLKRPDSKFVLLVQLWPLHRLPDDGLYWKKSVLLMKNFCYWAIPICQNQGSISSPLSMKNKITFCTIWAIFGRKQAMVTSQGIRIKIWHMLFHLHNSWSTSCKKVLVPALSSFAAMGHKGYFKKVLTRIFTFGCFYWYYAYIFEKIS